MTAIRLRATPRRPPLVSLSDSPLSANEFVARLQAHSQSYYSHHPFHTKMHQGKLTQPQLQGWVANRFYYQKSIPVKDAAILSNCPSPEVRRIWIQRIIDHDGTSTTAGGLEAWLRLGEAVGLTRAEILDERHVVPGVRFACDAYVNFARTQPWVIAVASSLTELFAPDLMRERIAVFETYYPWVEPAGLAYFKARLIQAPRDSVHGLQVVQQYCTTRVMQEQAIQALTFKCDVLWTLIDAIYHAYKVGRTR